MNNQDVDHTGRKKEIDWSESCTKNKTINTNWSVLELFLCACFPLVWRTFQLWFIVLIQKLINKLHHLPLIITCKALFGKL